jgi:ubiquitin-conjugating enzyme E2 G1
MLMLTKQLKDIQNDTGSGFSCGLINNNIYQWKVVLIGPQNTVYEGGSFPDILDFSQEFPNNLPKMKFTCPLFHQNIGSNGEG